MKNASISFSYDEEKLAALCLYLEQKGQTVESELSAAVDGLYTKTVPTNVRDYIDLRTKAATPADKKKKPKPSAFTDPPRNGSESE